ncbi:MAG TPA: LuxR C-terminal-related transcriptional regulator [Streptosporangiaceae bacterium]|nr:LuxR C-terminal-related transcriptional regulator [Streptosporangiaceae bacterium]
MRLYGRERELAVLEGLTSLLDGQSDGARPGADGCSPAGLADPLAGGCAGHALVISGDAGSGKSALLAAAVGQAHDHGARVLGLAAVPRESEIRFAGLHRLLQPVLPLAADLPVRQRGALEAALGLGNQAETEADVLLIGMATLALVTGTRGEQPTLVAIDDAHWLDRSTASVLCLVARRLAGSRGLLIAAANSGVSPLDGAAPPFDGADLPQLRLERLADDAAWALLARRAPGLDQELREQLLPELAGSPLALTGPDEQFAAALDRLAIQAQRRGAVDVATAAITAAAEIDGRRRPPTTSGWQEAAPIGSLLATADRLKSDGQFGLAAESLRVAATQCWRGRAAGWTAAEVTSAVRRIGVPLTEPASLAALARADPVGAGAVVTTTVAGLSPDAADPAGTYLVSSAAACVGAFDLAAEFAGSAIAGLRAWARRDLLAQALVVQAWSAVHTGRGGAAIAASTEAADLARSASQPQCAVAATIAQAAVLAECGDAEPAQALIAQAEASLPTPASDLLAATQFARGHGAVANQCYAEGAAHLRRILDPADPAHHRFIGAWGLADLVEAAAATGDLGTAASYLAELESLAARSSGPLLRAEAAYARPLVADQAEAERLFLAALDRDLAGWPTWRARLQLNYGRWLRRQRQVARSRAPLRAARDNLDALRYRRLADCARQELRATGELRPSGELGATGELLATGQLRASRKPQAAGDLHASEPTWPAGQFRASGEHRDSQEPRDSSRRRLRTWDQLTPQELQIAKMAADGLSNRQIGTELHISHRTVGYHLHRTFPKLGITSRSQLHAAILNLA